MAAQAQVDNSNQNGQSPGGPPADSTAAPNAGGAPTTPTPTAPGVTVTAPAPPAEQPLPKLPPDEFTNCMRQTPHGLEGIDLTQVSLCEHQLNWEKHMLVEACINRDGKTALPRVIQACTESLDHKIFEGSARFFLIGNRAAAYFAQGDKQHALEDYNEAVELAPHNAELYYNRGVFYAAQSDNDSALRDFNSALVINHKLLPALLRRAKIYQTQGNLIGALADLSEAIGIQPKTAALWSERGYVSLLQGEFRNAIEDESQAIRLDPKLARAYYFRGAAFDGAGDPGSARSDIASALHLDPSLERFVTNKDKNSSVTHPP
jgi:Flp pilus assembly protein TadD